MPHSHKRQRLIEDGATLHCTKCDTEYGYDEFYWNYKTDTVYYWCKSCRTRRNRSYKKAIRAARKKQSARPPKQVAGSPKRTEMIAAGETKTCPRCNITKGIVDYYWETRNDRAFSCCKECWKADRKADYHENPRQKEYLAQWEKDAAERVEHDRKLQNKSREEWDELLKSDDHYMLDRWRMWYNRTRNGRGRQPK